MLIYIIISTILNIFLVLIGTKFLSHLSILEFIFIIYLFPIILNVILSILTILKKQLNLIYCFIYPSISLVAYIILGFILKGTYTWDKFVQNSTVTSGEMYIKINTNLVDGSQIIFVFLLYFLVEYISLKILERKVKKWQ